MATFGNPENALKRAEELENVGRKEAALEALHDLITSKRHRYSWQKPLETIMFKYVELCLELRRGRFAKDGLIQYRNVCKQVNVSSLQEVIKYFLHLSTEKAGGAVEASGRMALDHVEDLEAEKRPEDLMLSCVSVSGEKEQELVTPWLKFLWETYRTVLEVLRNNSKVEALYAMTAQRAFRFCLQYKRTTEFRRLCEIIRNHLVNLTKYRDQKDMPDLNLPETLQLYLDTRFEQLKVATELELWQEAFRSIEDIHGVMCMVKKTPKPQMMAIYYSKLTKIFWISESHLNHGYAWYKLFILQKRYNKNLTHKDLQLMASSVLLAAISVMPYDHKHGGHHSELKNDEERSLRMARLLGFSLDPKTDNKETLSRSALISELVSKGVMTYVPQTVKDLYHLLEIDFHPLDLADKVQPLLGKLSELSDKLSSASPVPEVQLEQYIPALQRLTTLRVLQQVSQVYQTMKITALSRMIPFSDFADVEKLSVDAAKCNFLQLKIDHLKGIVQFGSQDLESWDKIRNHLTILAKRLNKGRSLIHEGIEKVAKAPQHDDLPVLLQDIEKEHSRLLARKVLIERRKEEHERQMREMEREEESKKLKQQRISEEAEEKRRAFEYQKRKEERIRREIEEKESEEANSLMLQQAERRKGKKPKNPAAIAIAIEGEKVTKQMVMEQAMQELLNKRQEMERKFHKLEKARDYLERAKREEEAPLIEAAYQKHLVDDEIFFQHRQQQGIEERRQQHVADVAQKKRLIRMLSDKNVFHNQVVSRREGEFERLKREREERVAEVRAIRKQEREMRRKMEHYRRQEAARLIKLKEEEEGRKREEGGGGGGGESKRKQDAERKAKLDEIAENQKQRERELEEERLRREDLIKEEQIGSKAASQPTANKFVPRALRKAVESAGSTEADNERWRRGDNRQSHVHAGRDGHPIPTLREADAPAQARDRYAPPSRKYEPPTKRTQTETQGKYERPRVVSGRLEPPPGGRDAQQGQGQGPPLGRYGQRPKNGAFGSGNTRDERDRDSDSDRWGASRGNTRDERDRDDHRGNTRDERDRDRWGAGPDHREGQRDGDRSAMAADNWRRPSKLNQPDSHK